MTRQRQSSNASSTTSTTEFDQELDSMYDYLAKIILVGPSGSGKSCLLHRFVQSQWRILSSQTIGVEFSSKIIKIGSGIRRKRIKLQLWDTAGTERFRSVSRSYYRGAAGAILVYDIASHGSFDALPTFLNDARALASPNLAVLLAGNKSDLSSNQPFQDESISTPTTPSSFSSRNSAFLHESSSGGRKSLSKHSSIGYDLGSHLTATIALDGREVTQEEASRWASRSNIPVSVEVSAYTGDGVDDVFARLARMILTKIELGEIDPDDPQSGIQYGDSGAWGMGESGSAKTGGTAGGTRKRRTVTNGWKGGMREWEDVFRFDGPGRRRRACC